METMAFPVEFSDQTTRARSIMTLDGYVSRGKSPPNSVFRDHDMLQDFAVYLELRLKSQNLSMLRRIFADFLNVHENTLVPMMQQGCTMITIFPMLRTSAKRRHQAEVLLTKPKSHLDTRGCVFLYLQYRVATRNMALLKHLFLEFVYHQETSLLAFVERGCQVISVIPFELPQMRPPPTRMESPRAVEIVAEQEQVTETVVQQAKKKRKGRVSVKMRSNAASEAAIPDDVNKRRHNHGAVLSTSELTDSMAIVDKSVYPASSPAAVAVTTSKRGKRTKARVVSPLLEAAAIAMDQARSAVDPREAETAVSPEQNGAVNALKYTGTVAAPEQAGVSPELPQLSPTRKGGRKRKYESRKQNLIKEKSQTRGKPTMSEEILRSQLKLACKMEIFVAQSPWEAVYGNLPPPFEEENHPEVSRKFRKFWHKHSHAVWERKFWVPISRSRDGSAFNKRNNRQLTAKNAFESLIVDVYKEFGAEFFVRLDTQKPRHPGWWYRGPVVALFALQQLKGENAMWKYVHNDALERFPDCKLPLPLATSTNCDAMRSRHKRESESMWMANHPLTLGILQEMAALKEEQQLREQATTADSNQELENAANMVDPLEFM